MSIRERLIQSRFSPCIVGFRHTGTKASTQEDIDMAHYQLITVVGSRLVRFCVGETVAYLESIAEKSRLTYYVIEAV